MPSLPLIVAGLAVLLAGAYLVGLWRKSGSLPLPPGPPRLPIIGNMHQAPVLWPWREYFEWSKKYGPIMSMVFGNDIIIMLSSHAVAKDLLDKRSNLYSSRPHLVMGSDCVSRGNRSLLMPYSTQYRAHQRVQGGLLHSRYTQHYVKLQDLESKQLMYDLLSAKNDDEWMDHFHRYTSSLMFGLIYGKRMPVGNEQEIKSIETVMANFLYSARVGTWIVDAIPILNNLPKFMAPWKRIGDEYHAFESDFYIRSLAAAEQSKDWNLAKQAKMWKETEGMSRKELAYCVGILYEAGSDTTTMALQSFVMAALAHPGVTKEAQKELDKELGEQYPTFEDRPRLPQIEALIKETLRWRPVSAGGIPHAIDQKDDEYMGYRIPKGSTVIPNHWAMNFDEQVYGKDASTFRPQRWIENPNLPLASFGYGRRMCTGQHLATASLYINIARVLWAFDIEHAVDASGERIEVDPLAYGQGFNSGPLRFKARFVLRSLDRQAVVEEQWAVVEKDMSVVVHDIEVATSRSK